MLARGLAARRPDLIEGIVAMGSPVLAPGAVHKLLAWDAELLSRLTRAGFGGLMSEDCFGGECARLSFEETHAPLDPDVGFTAIYSQRDGIVDWRACLDPAARAGRGAHQPLRHGGGPGRDRPRADGAARAAAQPGQPVGSSARRGGFAPRRSQVIAATSIAAGDQPGQAGLVDGYAGARTAEGVEVEQLGQRGGHEGVAGADGVDDLDGPRRAVHDVGSPVNAVAPSGPRVSSTSSVRSPASRARATSSGSASGRSSCASSSLSLTRVQRAPSVAHVDPGGVVVVHEARPQVGVVADEHVAGPGLLDEVEDAVAAGLQHRAQRADVQRVAGGQLLARAGSTPGRSRSSRRRCASRWAVATEVRPLEVGTSTISAPLAVTCCTTSPPRSSWPTWVIRVAGTSSRPSPTATLSGEPPGVSVESPSASSTTSISASPTTTITRSCSALEVDVGVRAQLAQLVLGLIERIVPLRERITSECVEAPPAR